MIKKPPFIILAILCLLKLAQPSQAHAAYKYYVSITVTSTASVASGTNANFPMLVSSTVTGWESSSTGAGARIQNLVTAPNGGQEPADLIFVTSTPTVSGSNWNCGTSLNFETEQYTSSTGALIDWVNVPTMATATVLYACYGDSTVTTDQSHPSSTWDTDYKGVYHFPNIAGLNASDSTQYANNGIAYGATATSSGQVDGAANFVSASSQYVDTGNTPNSPASLTYTAWVNMASFPNAYNTVIGKQGGSGYASFHIKSTGKLAPYVHTGAVTNIDYDGTGNFTLATGTWYDLAMVYDSVNGLVGYVNGAVDGAVAANGTLTADTASTSIGTDLVNAGRYVNGVIDEVRLSDIARSPSWILTEYNNENSPSTFYTLGAEMAASTPTGEGTSLCSVYQLSSYGGTYY